MTFSLLAFPFLGVVLSFTTVAIMVFSPISTCGERTVGKWFHLEICLWNFKYYIVKLYQWEIWCLSNHMYYKCFIGFFSIPVTISFKLRF